MKFTKNIAKNITMPIEFKFDDFFGEFSNKEDCFLFNVRNMIEQKAFGKDGWRGCWGMTDGKVIYLDDNNQFLGEIDYYKMKYRLLGPSKIPKTK